MKAKDFWNYLCNDLDYRFFSGVPGPGYKGLFKAMDSSIMHYVPAANEKIATALVSGISSSGVKGAVLVTAPNLDKVLFWFSFLELPIMIISTKLDKKVSIYSKVLTEDFKVDLLELSSYISLNQKPGILFFEEDQVL